MEKKLSLNKKTVVNLDQKLNSLNNENLRVLQGGKNTNGCTEGNTSGCTDGCPSILASLFNCTNSYCTQDCWRQTITQMEVNKPVVYESKADFAK